MVSDDVEGATRAGGGATGGVFDGAWALALRDPGKVIDESSGFQ